MLVPLSVCESVYVSNTARNKSAYTLDPVLHGVSPGMSRNCKHVRTHQGDQTPPLIGDGPVFFWKGGSGGGGYEKY